MQSVPDGFLEILFWKLKILQKMYIYDSLTFLASSNFSFWWLIFSSVLLAKSWKLQKLLNVISSFNFWFQFVYTYDTSLLDELSSVLMRRDVNNNIKKDSPIISHPSLAPVIVNNNAQTKHDRSQISK